MSCKCPKCGEADNYTRDELQPEEDEIIVRCHCNICDAEFDEIFVYTRTIKR